MKFAIIGNTGSGKSTLARTLASEFSCHVLDLDLVFWDSGTVERPSAERIAEVQRFCRGQESWIVEGCYTDLITASLAWKPELILMDPGQEVCISNCRRRPYEPHKYQTKEEQDRHLDLLLAWASDYYAGDGLISHLRHKELFDLYDGPKRIVTEQK